MHIFKETELGESGDQELQGRKGGIENSNKDLKDGTTSSSSREKKKGKRGLYMATNGRFKT